MTGYDSRQVERERRERADAVARRSAAEERQLERGRVPGRVEGAAMRRLWDAYLTAVEAWLERSAAGPGRHSEVAPWVLAAGAEAACAATLGVVARGLLRRSGLVQVAEQIGERLRDELRWKVCRAEAPTQAAKTARNPARAGGLERRAPILAKSLGLDVRFPRRARIRAGVTLLELLRQSTGAVEFVRALHPGRSVGWRSLTVVCPSPEFEAWLADVLAAPGVRAAHGPMVAEPRPWAGDVGGGRHLDVSRRLVKGRPRGGDEGPAGARMRRIANALQSVAWRVNTDVYWTLRRVWEETGRPVGQLPLRDDLPLPPWDPDASVEARTEAAALLHQNRSARSRRLAVLYALRACEQLSVDGGTDLWYPVQYDYRGRVYYDVSYLSPQGNDLERGLLRFAGAAEPLDDATRAVMRVHLANLAGRDKLTYGERVAWAESRQAELAAVAADPVGNLDLWEGAEEPWQYLAAAQALVRGDDGALPIYSDATCNGLQVFALLLRDRETAARVNVVAGPEDARPRDVYAEVAGRAAELLPQAGAEAARLADWLEGTLPRKLVKRTVMTLPYGVTKATSRSYLHEHLEEKIREGRRWPGSAAEFKAATRALADVVWDAVWELLPAAMRCREWLSEAARAVGQPFYWETPLGFRAWSAPERCRRSSLVTSVHGRRVAAAIREGTGEIDRRKQASIMPPNFVHSLDATCLHLAAETVIGTGRPWAGVHDCVGVRAGDYAFAARTIRRAYADVFREDLLEDLARQLRERYDVVVPDPPERGDLDPEEIVRSPYAFN